jgi:hypothetical protein
MPVHRSVYVLLAWFAMESAAIAQPAADHPRTTIVQVELLSGPDGGALTAQDWRSVFQTLDVEVLIRRGILDDKPAVKEKIVGTLRYVTIIGQLDRNGRLQFPDKTFNRGDGPKLKEWLDELKTYGSQGAPSGKPLWGLSKTQFEQLYAALATTSDEDLVGEPLVAAMARLKLPAAYPLRWSTAAKEQLDLAGDKVVVRQSLAGFTRATQLAVMLNDHGCGFRPNRTPAGSLELVVEVQSPQSDHWPIGWPVDKQAPHAMPGLFAMTTIELDKTPLVDLLPAAAELTGTPMLLDYAELARRQLDPAKIRVEHRYKKTTWSLALRAMLVPQKLNREYWQDEAGRPFVWITAVGKSRPQPAESP